MSGMEAQFGAVPFDSYVPVCCYEKL
jgi:hypothetical protein